MSEANTIYQKRSYGDRINTTFAFMREHIRVLLRLCLPFMLPFSVMVALVYTVEEIGIDVNGTDLEMLKSISLSDTASEIIIIATSLFTVSTVVPMTFTVINAAERGPENVNKLRFKDIRKDFVLNTAKWVLMALPVIILILLLVIIPSDFVSYGLLILLTLVVMFLMSLSRAEFLLSKSSTYGGSIFKSANYVTKSHGASTPIFILALMVICTFIFLWEIWVVSAIGEFKIELIGNDPSKHLVAYSVYWLLFFALHTLIFISISLVLVLITVGKAYQYGTVEDRISHMSIKQRIKNFEKLRDS